MGLPSLSLRRPFCNSNECYHNSIWIYWIQIFRRKRISIHRSTSQLQVRYIPGANADIIESQITEPLENAINGVQGIRTISSASNQRSSSITVEFDLSIDLETAANDVRDKVSQATRLLPQDIDAPPKLYQKQMQIPMLLFSMTVQSDSKTILELNDYAVNVLQQRLQTIPGVSSFKFGDKKLRHAMWFDPKNGCLSMLTARYSKCTNANQC